jgi:uncharacterized protein YbjT (DUF2867 family)
MILVAGATGSLGSRLVPRLAVGVERVRALVRPPASMRGVASEVEVLEGDVRDRDAVARAVAGVRAVVCAVSGFGGREASDVRSVDGEGTRNLIAAAADAGADHFVFVSVFGAAPDHPLELQREKFRSEEAVRECGIGWTIVRPAPSGDTWVHVVGDAVASGGKALVLGRGRNPISFVATDDVATVIVDALAGGPDRRVVPVTGPEDVSLQGIVERIGRNLGHEVGMRRVPRTALRAMAHLARPFRPAIAARAHAAVLMDTTDMRYRPAGAVVGGMRIDDVLASAPTSVA